MTVDEVDRALGKPNADSIDENDTSGGIKAYDLTYDYSDIKGRDAIITLMFLKNYLKEVMVDAKIDGKELRYTQRYIEADNTIYTKDYDGTETWATPGR